MADQTELERREAVLVAFADLNEADIGVIFASAKGLMEQRAMLDPTDVTPAMAALDALLAYFRLRHS